MSETEDTRHVPEDVIFALEDALDTMNAALTAGVELFSPTQFSWSDLLSLRDKLAHLEDYATFVLADNTEETWNRG